MTVCPCCGQNMLGPAPADALIDAQLGLQQRILVDTLARAFPRAVTIEALIDILYGNRPNGGPDDAPQTIRSVISQTRHRLRPLGWTVSSASQGRGVKGRYRLERLA